MDSNLTNDAAIKMLETQLNSGLNLLAHRPIDKDELDAWQAVTENYLRSVYGNSSPEIHKVFPHRMLAVPGSAGPDWWADLYEKRLKSATTILKGLIGQLITKSEIIASSTQSNKRKIKKSESNIDKSSSTTSWSWIYIAAAAITIIVGAIVIWQFYLEP